MKNILILIVVAFCLLTGSTYAQSNLVPNGGFEDGIDQNWVLLGGESNITYTLDNTEAIEGTNCLRAELVELGANPWSIQIKNPFGPVEEGHLYKASIWIKSATKGSTVNFTIGKNTANYDEYASTYGMSISTEWTKYTMEFTAEVSTPDDITLAMHITSTDTYWFDDFRVIEVTEEVSGAEVNASGDRVELVFVTNLAILIPEDQLPFFVYSDETNYSVSDVNPGSASNELVLILEDPVVAGETINVEYIPGTLRSSAGIEIQWFVFEAENNSEYEPSALADNRIQNFKVFPSPVTDFVTISNEAGALISSVKIIDLGGRTIEVIDTGMETNSIHINLNHLQKGAYMLLIEDSEKAVSVSKIIKN